MEVPSNSQFVYGILHYKPSIWGSNPIYGNLHTYIYIYRYIYIYIFRFIYINIDLYIYSCLPLQVLTPGPIAGAAGMALAAEETGPHMYALRGHVSTSRCDERAALRDTFTVTHTTSLVFCQYFKRQYDHSRDWSRLLIDR